MSRPMTARFQEQVLGAIREAEALTARAVFNTLDFHVDAALKNIEDAIDALQRAEVIVTNNKLPNSFA